jgi:hypothetical protein
VRLEGLLAPVEFGEDHFDGPFAFLLPHGRLESLLLPGKKAFYESIPIICLYASFENEQHGSSYRLRFYRENYGRANALRKNEGARHLVPVVYMHKNRELTLSQR